MARADHPRPPVQAPVIKSLPVERIASDGALAVPVSAPELSDPMESEVVQRMLVELCQLETRIDNASGGTDHGTNVSAVHAAATTAIGSRVAEDASLALAQLALHEVGVSASRIVRNRAHVFPT